MLIAKEKKRKNFNTIKMPPYIGQALSYFPEKTLINDLLYILLDLKYCQSSSSITNI